MSQYRANLCQTTCTGPHTIFGLSTDLPAARRLARHRHLAAMPASMHASDEPMAEAPTVLAACGAFHRSAIMCTHRRSISAVCGYSSRSIMFLLIDSAISARTSGSSHVWQNVARFCRALPSSISSSDTNWNASLGSVPTAGNRYLGTGLVRSRSANTLSAIWSRMLSRSCKDIAASLRSKPPKHRVKRLAAVSSALTVGETRPVLFQRAQVRTSSGTGLGGRTRHAGGVPLAQQSGLVRRSGASSLTPACLADA